MVKINNKMFVLVYVNVKIDESLIYKIVGIAEKAS